MLLKFSEYCQGLTVSCSFLLLLFCFVLNRECCCFSSFSLRHSEAVMYLTRLLYFFPHKIIPILSYPQLSFGLWRNTPCFLDQPATSSTAINAGCTGYLTKDCMSEREAVHGGELQSSVLLLLNSPALSCVPRDFSNLSLAQVGLYFAVYLRSSISSLCRYLMYLILRT